MPDIITINKELGIIEVHSAGKVQKKDILDSLNQILKFQKETGLNKLFVDTTQQATMPTTTEAFDIFSDFPPELNTAFLVRPNQPTQEDIIFAETVGRNRSGRIKIFQDKAAAVEWLNAD